MNRKTRDPDQKKTEQAEPMKQATKKPENKNKIKKAEKARKAKAAKAKKEKLKREKAKKKAEESAARKAAAKEEKEKKKQARLKAKKEKIKNRTEKSENEKHQARMKRRITATVAVLAVSFILIMQSSIYFYVFGVFMLAFACIYMFMFMLFIVQEANEFESERGKSDRRLRFMLEKLKSYSICMGAAILIVAASVCIMGGITFAGYYQQRMKFEHPSAKIVRNYESIMKNESDMKYYMTYNDSDKNKISGKLFYVNAKGVFEEEIKISDPEYVGGCAKSKYVHILSASEYSKKKAAAMAVKK